MRKLLLLPFLLMMLGSCIKNKGTRTYTLYYPKYATKQEVRDAVKLQAPKALDNLGSFALYQNWVLVNEIEKGVHVIDMSSGSPVNTGYIPIPGNRGIAVRNNILLADCFTDLYSINIQDIQNLKLDAVKENVFTHRQNMYGFNDNGLVFIEWISKDTTVNEEFFESQYYLNTFYAGSLTTAGAPPTAGGNSTGSSLASFTLVNNYLYAVDQRDLYAFSVDNPLLPVLKSSQMVNWNIETIYPFKDRLFIGSQTGMFMYSIQNPDQPTLIAQFAHANVCDPVIADDHHAYVTLRSGTQCNGFTNQLDVLDISNINSPQLVKTYPLNNPHGLSKDGNLLFICDGDAGLKLFDATDKNNIVLKNTLPIGKCVDVVASQGKAIVITDTGLYVYQYGADYSLNLIGKIARI